MGFISRRIAEVLLTGNRSSELHWICSILFASHSEQDYFLAWAHGTRDLFRLKEPGELERVPKNLEFLFAGQERFCTTVRCGSVSNPTALSCCRNEF
jgi:hypothetical protein